ncbi:hypothetical protein CW751_14945 [Brumimicrobium salinarum]|uniref:Uncharacterized protein n=1 Tax=Brumimicrobium salinarum TaxID=2058658 RepID=A0A2I0QYR4_9FLAO|nr:hypothetical protein [Brumimicrobium salinarum]PKR79475.1 hypothetical protein CW751_14945 [Brumimicrobium salinarum]
MKSIKEFEGKKLVNKGVNLVKGGKRTPTRNNDLTIVRVTRLYSKQITIGIRLIMMDGEINKEYML